MSGELILGTRGHPRGCLQGREEGGWEAGEVLVTHEVSGEIKPSL